MHHAAEGHQQHEEVKGEEDEGEEERKHQVDCRVGSVLRELRDRNLAYKTRAKETRGEGRVNREYSNHRCYNKAGELTCTLQAKRS